MKSEDDKKVEINNRKLDACHGRVRTEIWDGHAVDTDHYHRAFKYPFSIGCVRGAPLSAE